MTKEWTKYKETILTLYKDQSKTLEEVRRIMRDDYGFEASVRAYRSRFDKWRVNKYNVARRRSATATMAAAAGDISRVDPFLETGLQCQMPWTRHYSAPDLMIIENEGSFYTQHAVHPQIESEPHIDETSPVGSAFGQDALEHTYCALTMQEDQNLKTLVHRFAHQGDGIGAAQEQTLLGGHFPCHGQTTPSCTELELITPILQVPFQPGQLETLLRCLRTRPDIHELLATGHPPFSLMANLLLDHLSPRSHTAGDRGGDDLLRVLCQCLLHFLHQGADLNVLVGGSPLLFHLLDAPVATRAFGPLWNFVQTLALHALPVQQDCGGGNAPNALHVLLGRSPGCSSPPAAAAAAAAAEVQNRVQLTMTLIQRLAGLGRLGDRGPQGLSAFHLYLRDFAASDGHYFFQVSAEFVKHGADADGVVPCGFADDVRAIFGNGALFSSNDDDKNSNINSDNNNDTTTSSSSSSSSPTAAALWATIWISACQRSVSGDAAAADEHLAVLEHCTEGKVSAKALRALLPRPPAVLAASPATSRSEASKEGGYMW